METQINDEKETRQSNPNKRRVGVVVYMSKNMPIGMQAYNIKVFLVNNGFDPSQIDIEAYMDRNLSLTENKKLFAQKLGIPMRQLGGQEKASSGRNYTKSSKKEIDESYCDWLAENCEIKCNNSACKTYKKEGCGGEVTPCKPSRYTKSIRKNASGSTSGDCKVMAYCVAAHTRPPQHNSRTGKDILVKGYCVPQHPRLCRRSGYE